MFPGKIAPGILREERKKSGMTQQQISEYLGLDRSTYSYYESGRLQPPSEVLNKLASYYNMPVSLFFTESDNTLTFRSNDAFDRFKTENLEREFKDTEFLREADEDSFTVEEKRLLSQLRARSCCENEEDVIQTLEIEEFIDDEMLSYLIDPDDD